MDVREEIIDICDSLADCSKIILELSKRVKKLKKHMKRPTKNKGIMKKCKLSPSLCTFMHRSPDVRMSRNEVKSYLCIYIDSQKLCTSLDNKNEFTPDANMRPLLSPLSDKDRSGTTNKQNRTYKGYTKFNILKYIKHHFTPDP